MLTKPCSAAAKAVPLLLCVIAAAAAAGAPSTTHQLAAAWGERAPGTLPGMPASSVTVHLFEWSWADVATECETFLAPAGYKAVQVHTKTAISLCNSCCSTAPPTHLAVLACADMHAHC